jgi:hypothetical protein
MLAFVACFFPTMGAIVFRQALTPSIRATVEALESAFYLNRVD